MHSKGYITMADTAFSSSAYYNHIPEESHQVSFTNELQSDCGEFDGTRGADVEELQYFGNDPKYNSENDSISSIWENEWFNHAVLVGRFIAEDLVQSDKAETSLLQEEVKTDCNKKNSASSERKSKRKKQSAASKGVYKCQYCDREFPTRWKKNYHQANVHSKIQLQCTECSKVFVNAQQLQVHLKSHLNLRAFSCNHEGCTATFLTAQHLQNHTLVHTGEKPFKCDKCDKSFREKNTLRRHQVSHSKAKTYTCDVCQRVFAYASSRRVHCKRLHPNVTTSTSKDYTPTLLNM